MKAPAKNLPPKPTLKLNLAESSSSIWLKVAGWAREQIDSAHKRNESIDQDERETAALRGEIRFAKRLLALAETSD